MKYVASVEGQVKGKVKTELGPRTLIVGPNWSHKSAIVNAVELALTGAASDVMGRAVVRDPATLESLGDERAVSASVLLSDGVKVSWSKEPGKRAVGPAPQVAVSFPLREVREALAGNANTVRQFFLRLAADKVTWQDVLARVPAALHGRVDAVAPASGAVPERLLAALDLSSTRLREARATAKAQAAFAAGVGSGLGPPPSEAELTAARATLDSRRAAIERMERACEIAALVEQGTALRRELSGLSGPTPADEHRPAQMKLVKFAADHNLAECPVCGKAAAPAGAAPDWAARLAKVNEKIVARERVLEGYRAVQAKLEDVRMQLRRHNYDAEGPLDHPDTAIVEALIAGQTDPTAELEELHGDQAAAQQIYDEMQRTWGAWDQIRRTRDLALEAEEDARAWDLLATVLRRAVAELLDASVDAFRARVQAHLPESWKFELQLRDGEKEVCRYGLVQGGRLCTALSGGQWAAVTVALACVVLERSSIGEAGLAIVVPEDRAWDPGALSEVLTALARAPCQVIVATTTAPEPAPPGWLILQTAQDGTIVSRVETVLLKKGHPEAKRPAAPPAPPDGAPRRRGRPPKSEAGAPPAPPPPPPAPAPDLPLELE